MHPGTQIQLTYTYLHDAFYRFNLRATTLQGSDWLVIVSLVDFDIRLEENRVTCDIEETL